MSREGRRALRATLDFGENYYYYSIYTWCPNIVHNVPAFPQKRIMQWAGKYSIYFLWRTVNII